MREEVHAQSSGFALNFSIRDLADHFGHRCPALIFAPAPGSHNPSDAAIAKNHAASQNCLFFVRQIRGKVEDRAIKESIWPKNHAPILGRFNNAALTLLEFSERIGPHG